jgi:hypothetical protein
VRVECNYKIGIESKVGWGSSEIVRRHTPSDIHKDSMKHYSVLNG